MTKENYELTATEKSLKEMDDSRDIPNDLMNAFIGRDDAFFKAFWEFTEKHDNLAVCFRGNSNPKSIIIYHFNHIVWELSIVDRPPKYTVKISLNHARYLEDYEKCLEDLKNLSFNCKKKKICRKKNTASIGSLTYQSNIPYNKDFVEITYNWIVEKMMDSFFNPNKDTDYFRKACGMAQSTRSKSPYVEKRWQQSLFKKFQKANDQKLFIYDMEFSQKSTSESNAEPKCPVNEPDMLGVRYDKNGEIVSLVLIEVKSTYDACKNEQSGIKAHLEKMNTYSNVQILIQNRKDDIPRILKRYKQLNILPEIIQIPQKSCSNILVERLLILTNCVTPEPERNTKVRKSAIKYFHGHESQIKSLAKKNLCDIWLTDGNYYDDFEIIKQNLD